MQFKDYGYLSKQPNTYGIWRNDDTKPEAGFSNELISSESRNILYQTDLDTLKALPFDGVDTMLKAFKKNVISIPNSPFLGHDTF